MHTGKRPYDHPSGPSLGIDEEACLSVDSATRSVSSARSAHTRRVKRQRTSLALERDADEEATFRERYCHFEFVGKQPRYSGMSMEPLLAEPCEFFSEFLRQKTSPIANFDPTSHVFVRSNSLVQLNHLERFNRPQHVMPLEYKGVLAVASDLVDSILTLDSKIPFPTVSDLAGVRYYGDKFAGIEYAMRGFRSRSEAHPVALQDAEEAWLAMRRGERVEPHLNRIGGRGKLAKREEVESLGGQLDKGRLIMMTSHRDLLLNGVVEQRLTAAYKPDRYPIAVGTTWWHGGCQAFAERFRRFDRYWCFDAKKYDASLPGWLVKIALRILRRQFVEGEDPVYDAYWDFVYEGLVRAPMFLDNGLVFKRFDGTTSGHSFNTLVQSVCTLIVGYSSFLECVGMSHAQALATSLWLESLGDDQIGGGEDVFADLTVEDVAEKAWAIFGIDWFGKKSYYTDILVDQQTGEFQGVQFLGKYFRVFRRFEDNRLVGGLIPYRPRDETLYRLFYPEWHAEGVNAAWERAVGHYADAAGNPQTLEILEEYLDWLEPQLPSLEFTWSENWRRKFTGQDPLNDPRVPPRRVTFDEWLRLVLI